MKDRALLLGGLVALMLGVLGLVLNLAWPVSPAAVTPPWEGRASGQVKEFSLAVGRTRWELGRAS